MTRWAGNRADWPARPILLVTVRIISLVTDFEVASWSPPLKSSTETPICLRHIGVSVSPQANKEIVRVKYCSLTWFNSIVYHRDKLCHGFFGGSSDAHFSSCKNIKQAFWAVSTDILSLLLQRFISELQTLGIRENWLVTWMVECRVALSLLVDKKGLVWSCNPLELKVMATRYYYVYPNKNRTVVFHHYLQDLTFNFVKERLCSNWSLHAPKQQVCFISNDGSYEISLPSYFLNSTPDKSNFPYTSSFRLCRTEAPFTLCRRNFKTRPSSVILHLCLGKTQAGEDQVIITLSFTKSIVS